MKSITSPNRNRHRSAAAAAAITVLLATAAGTTALAQGQLAFGTVSSSGTGPYIYDLTFGDAANATSSIGSVWYAWIPGQFFLPGTPASASAPAGWTAHISGASVQFVATSSAFDITAGNSLSGFSYQAAFTPTQLAAAANSGESDAYSAGLFSDSGNIFTVEAAAVPEPATPALLILGAAVLVVVGQRKILAA